MLQPWQGSGQNRRDVHLFAEWRPHLPRFPLSPNENIRMDTAEPSHQQAFVTQMQTVQSFLREVLPLRVFAYHPRPFACQKEDPTVLARNKEERRCRGSRKSQRTGRSSGGGKFSEESAHSFTEERTD